MARGGKRQGTPGVGYSNRTDLNQNRAPQTGLNTAASAGVVPTLGQPAQPSATYPEDIPKLDDPTARPDEPVTTGLMSGAGLGPNAIGPMPPNPALQDLEAAFLANPTPELSRVIQRVRAKGQY